MLAPTLQLTSNLIGTCCVPSSLLSYHPLSFSLYYSLLHPLLKQLCRELAEGEEVGPVYATYYPKEKAEGWWVVLGDPKTNQLSGIKNILSNEEGWGGRGEKGRDER